MEGLGLGNNKGYVIAIGIALIFVAALLTGYYFWTRGPPEGYSEINILGTNGQAADYPDILLIGQNNTFSIVVTVTNHMGKTLPFEVRVKITEQTRPDFPVPGEAKNIYPLTLENGGKWNTTVTTTIDTPGNYMVVYELWVQDENSGALQFTENACVLNVEAINQT